MVGGHDISVGWGGVGALICVVRTCWWRSWKNDKDVNGGRVPLGVMSLSLGLVTRLLVRG